MADEADREHVDDTAESDGTASSDKSLGDLTPAIERVEAERGNDFTLAIERVEDEGEREPYGDLPSAVERVEEDTSQYGGPQGHRLGMKPEDEDEDEGEDEDDGPNFGPEPGPGTLESPNEGPEGDPMDIEDPIEPFEEEPMEVYQEPEAHQMGPESDQEMPLADHVEEMVKRLGVIIVIMAIVSGLIFPFGERLINFLWYSILPGTDVARPRLYHPLALILSQLKVATLGGFVIALPVFVYEAYLFMRPGLYPRERRYFLASVPTSLVLSAFGVVFAWRLVLPALFTYFLRYSERATVIAFGLTQTFDLMLVIMGFFALIFQIPLFIMLAIMMGVTSREWLESRRLYFWGAFVGVALVFSPDPTGMVPFIVAATMLILFEGTLLLLRWTGR